MIGHNEKLSKEVITSNLGNIINDIEEDIIYLIGRKTEEGKNTLYEEMEIVISDGLNGKLTYIDLINIKGYNPKIIMRKFTALKKNEVLFIVEDEKQNESIRYIIYRYYNGIIETIFDSNEYLRRNRYKVIYDDNYKVKLIDGIKNTSYIIDIENNYLRYINEKYKSDGKLIKNYQGKVLYPYEVLEVRNNDRELFDLLLKQKITGEDINDILGEIISTLRFDGNKFNELNNLL